MATAVERKGTVLIVDDEPDIRRLFCLILRQGGWQTHAASNGKEALEAIASLVPDVVVVDQRMPEMTGSELCEKLRQRGLTCPVVLVSAASDLQSIAERVGVACYLMKPVGIEALLGVVRRASSGQC